LIECVIEWLLFVLIINVRLKLLTFIFHMFNTLYTILRAFFFHSVSISSFFSSVASLLSSASSPLPVPPLGASLNINSS
jgi:hypothetical protein